MLLRLLRLMKRGERMENTIATAKRIRKTVERRRTSSRLVARASVTVRFPTSGTQHDFVRRRFLAGEFPRNRALVHHQNAITDPQHLRQVGGDHQDADPVLCLLYT